mgnify:CR=1 FL=1
MNTSQEPEPQTPTPKFTPNDAYERLQELWGSANDCLALYCPAVTTAILTDGPIHSLHWGRIKSKRQLFVIFGDMDRMPCTELSVQLRAELWPYVQPLVSKCMKEQKELLEKIATLKPLELP